ncbi:MAG: hypothetical protein ABIW82_02200 [Dokdonella sp.]
MSAHGALAGLVHERIVCIQRSLRATNHRSLNIASRAAFALYALAAGYDAHADARFTDNTTADLIGDNLGNGVCHTSTNASSLRAALKHANPWRAPA